MQKRIIYIAFLFVATFILEACNKSATPKEEKEEKQVETMIQSDEARADSMKKALGLE